MEKIEEGDRVRYEEEGLAVEGNVASIGKDSVHIEGIGRFFSIGRCTLLEKAEPETTIEPFAAVFASATEDWMPLLWASDNLFGFIGEPRECELFDLSGDLEDHGEDLSTDGEKASFDNLPACGMFLVTGSLEKDAKDGRLISFNIRAKVASTLEITNVVALESEGELG